jgi:Tol biopolymer transport system component
VVPADGSAPLAFVPGTEVDEHGFVGSPTWSPDGRRLAYVSGYGGEIVILRPDGSDRQTLHVDPGNDTIEELAWGVAAG